MIRFFNNNVTCRLNNKLILKKWIKNTAEKYDKTITELNIILCDDEKILEINKEFLQHNYYTDIITFDYCSDDNVEGELYISLDTVKANALEYKQNYLTELHRVIIHGVLHLIGFDDQSVAQKKQMRQKEDEALVELNKLIN